MVKYLYLQFIVQLSIFLSFHITTTIDEPNIHGLSVNPKTKGLKRKVTTKLIHPTFQTESNLKVQSEKAKLINGEKSDIAIPSGSVCSLGKPGGISAT